MRNRILVVDDSALVLRLLSMTLAKAGFDVLTASDGEEALKVARETHPQLIFLDAVLPGMSGFDVARAIEEDSTLQPRPYVVLLTGLETAVQSDLPPGIDAIVPKPFQPLQILKIAQRVLDGDA